MGEGERTMWKRRVSMSGNDRSGSAMIAALFVVTVIAVLSMAYLQLSLSKNRENKASVDAKRSLYIAEAGLSEAFVALAQGESGNVGSDAVPAQFADGVFWVTATNSGGGKLTLTSNGLCGTGRSSLSMVVEKASDSVASLGLFAGQDLTVESGCLIDSYDSSVADYVQKVLVIGDPPPADSRTGANGNIAVEGTLLAPTKVYGDARPGPSGSVTRSPYATITGSTAPSNMGVSLPAIDFPAVKDEGTVDYADSTKPLTIPLGDHGFSEIVVQGGAKATILGPANIVAGELHIVSGSTLTIDSTGGPVHVYVHGIVDLEAGSYVQTPNHDPSATSLMIASSDPPQILATGKFYGTIYAPSSDVVVPKSLEVFGAVAAKTVRVKSRAKVHFDLALENAGKESSVSLPRMTAWRIVDLPDSPMMRLRLDPLRWLRMQGVTPTRAADAHYNVGVAPPNSDPGVTLYTGGLASSLETPDQAGDGLNGGVPLSALGTSLLSEISDTTKTSSTVATALLAASPLESAVRIAAIERKPPLTASDLQTVLLTNSPLTETELIHVINHANYFTSPQLAAILIASSPLPYNITASIKSGGISLTPVGRTSVLAAQ